MGKHVLHWFRLARETVQALAGILLRDETPMEDAWSCTPSYQVAGEGRKFVPADYWRQSGDCKFGYTLCRARHAFTPVSSAPLLPATPVGHWPPGAAPRSVSYVNRIFLPFGRQLQPPCQLFVFRNVHVELAMRYGVPSLSKRADAPRQYPTVGSSPFAQPEFDPGKRRFHRWK